MDLLALKVPQFFTEEKNVMQVAFQQEILNIDFNSLYRSHEALIRRIIRGFRLSDDVADDLCQNIFVKAWKALPTLRHPQAISSWLKAIARHECLNEIRARKLQNQRLVAVDESQFEPTSIEESRFLDLDYKQFEEHIAFLESVIENHSDPLRKKVAQLFYVEHKKIKEIAELLRMKANTVLSHLRRFRIIMKQAMNIWLQQQAECD